MNKPRGFTLIELLVVIAIIALLMSVLLPSLKQAKELARQVCCMANVKSIATAWMIYRDDQEYCVLAGTGDGFSGGDPVGTAWRLRLSAYAGKNSWRGENWYDDGSSSFAARYAQANEELAEMDLWDCPSNDLLGRGATGTGAWGEYTLTNSAANRLRPDYPTTMKINGKTYPYPHPCGNNGHHSNNRCSKGVLNIRIILMDGYHAGGQDSSNSLTLFLWRQTDVHVDNNPEGSHKDSFSYPHLGSHLWNGETNIAFADQHVESATFYEAQENLVVRDYFGIWDGLRCKWYMDADEVHRPWNYSVNYQGGTGYPTPPGGLVLPPAWTGPYR